MHAYWGLGLIGVWGTRLRKYHCISTVLTAVGPASFVDTVYLLLCVCACVHTLLP